MYARVCVRVCVNMYPRVNVRVCVHKRFPGSAVSSEQVTIYLPELSGIHVWG